MTKAHLIALVAGWWSEAAAMVTRSALVQRLVLVAAASIVVGCPQSPPKATNPNAEAMDSSRPGNYSIQGDELKVVLHEKKGRDDVVVIAIQQRRLNRNELRALLNNLLGRAKTPTIDVYANQEAYGSCVRDQYGVVRGQANPADSLACSRGTVLRMDRAEPRVIYWGAAAPSSE